MNIPTKGLKEHPITTYKEFRSWSAEGINDLEKRFVLQVGKIYLCPEGNRENSPART